MTEEEKQRVGDLLADLDRIPDAYGQPGDDGDSLTASSVSQHTPLSLVQTGILFLVCLSAFDAIIANSV